MVKFHESRNVTCRQSSDFCSVKFLKFTSDHVLVLKYCGNHEAMGELNH